MTLDPSQTQRSLYSLVPQVVSQAVVSDRPAFPYRGLMIDTGRNFIPVRSLRRMVDAMAASKLNILHWHITDSNSFPFYSKSVPQVSVDTGSNRPVIFYLNNEANYFAVPKKNFISI